VKYYRFKPSEVLVHLRPIRHRAFSGVPSAELEDDYCRKVESFSPPADSPLRERNALDGMFLRSWVKAMNESLDAKKRVH